MENVQIKEIILWSKDDEPKIKIIKFKTGMLNIIHGASQTGKSALIPIIDYCLCSSENKIPIGIIRDNCSWFGIKLQADDKEILIVRENNDKHSSGICYYEDKKVEIPKKPSNNEKTENLKIRINSTLGISFFDMPSQKGTMSRARASFRDLVSFNFQSQNIVANPNCLLYKTDIALYRELIKSIFNYAIGAESSEQLKNKFYVEELKEKLAKLERQQKNEKEFRESLINKNQDILFKAAELGLIDGKDFDITNNHSVITNLEKISKKGLLDVNLSLKGAEIISKELESIINQIDSFYIELRKYKREKNNIEEILNLRKQYKGMLEVKRERLSISSFVKEFCKKNEKDASVISDVNVLCENLEHIENAIKNNSGTSQNTHFDKQLATIDNNIEEVSKQINILVRRKNFLKQEKDKKNILETVYEDIVVKSKIILDKYKEKDNELSDDIDKLREKIKNLDTENKEKEYLSLIIDEASKYIPKFAEFEELASFDNKDLTVKVRKQNSNKNYYLWETGSGSNWVAYHIAMMLGFHRHFIKKGSPVFNFLIFDQPSQVYFPKAKYDKQKKIYKLEKNEEDFKCVKEMFSLFSKSLSDNEGKLQIIVLDHAGKDVWGSIKNKHIVGHWTNEDPLVPLDWIKENEQIKIVFEE